MARQGAEGEMACLFELYPREQHQGLLDGLRELVADFEAQVWWRFRNYGLYPYLWTVLHHPAVDIPERERLVSMFFNDYQDCCRDPDTDAKIFKIFKDFPDRIRRVMEDKQFIAMVQARDVSHKFTNCCMERLLAAFRQWCGAEGALAERVCSAGFLGQFMTAHTQAGGSDPRGVSREQLIQDGVGLRCVAGKMSTKPAGSFVHWVAKEHATKPEGQTKAEYREWMTSKSEEFQGLSGLRKGLQVQGSRCAFLRKKTDQENSPASLPRPPAAVQSVIAQIGDERTPIRTDVFVKEIRKKCGVPERQDRVVGFTKYSGVFREGAQKRMLVRDDNSIDPARKFSYKLPCPLAHPGMCATLDKDFLPMLHGIVKQAYMWLLQQPRASFHHVRVIGSGDDDDDHVDHRTAWMMLCHTRQANPKVTQQQK